MDINETKKIMENLVEQAKLKVIKTYEHKDTTERRWLEANLDSYGTKDYRIKIFVLEGSPSKGIVIANYGRQIVFGFDALWNRIFRKSL